MRLLKGLGYAREAGGLGLSLAGQGGPETQPPAGAATGRGAGGRHPVYLVTSVLDPKSLTDQQVVEIYAPALGDGAVLPPFQADLRAAQAPQPHGEHAELEATWSLLGLWAMMLARPGGVVVRRDAGGARERGEGPAAPTAARCVSTRAIPTPGESLRELARHGVDRSLRPPRQDEPRLPPQETRATHRGPRNPSEQRQRKSNSLVNLEINTCDG